MSEVNESQDEEQKVAAAMEDTPQDTSKEDTVIEEEDDDVLSVDSNDSDVGFSPEQDPNELIAKAASLKEEGNAEFSKGNLSKACRLYREGATVLKPLNVENTGEDQVKALLVSLQNNLSMVCLKQDRPKMSADVASAALKIDATNVKAYYRRAAANRKLGNLDAAKDDLKEALKHDANNVSVRKELISLKKEMETKTEKEKKQLQKAFTSSKNSFLYDDKEEEDRKKAEIKKKKKQEAEEALKKRKVEWEDECVKRMSNNESAISFEDWDKERKEKEKELEKARKLEEQERKKAEQLARARESQTVVDHGSDDELTEQEKSMLRGYKKTSDGRTTSYFTRELSEEEKKLLAENSGPQKLDSTPARISPPPEKKASSSVWNKAGTWEEKDASDWCRSHLTTKLLSARATNEDQTFVAVITKVDSLTGEASVALAGGKKRYIFDYHSTLSYEVKDDAVDEVAASGSLALPDICSTSHDELEVDVLSWKKAPSSEHADIAAECRARLVQEVRLAVQEFVRDFNAHY